MPPTGPSAAAAPLLARREPARSEPARPERARAPSARAGAPRPPRALLYSHDTFGLGHLRRSRAIANALVAACPGLSVLIITGSPVAGSFEFGDGVDTLRLPGVVKLPDGDYTSRSLNLSIDEAVELRESLIRRAAEAFAPDLFLVDKEPAGFRGEALGALGLLRARGCRTVLGLRDVMDDPAALAAEWARKGAADAYARHYDEAWVYGLQEVYEPLAGVALPTPPGGGPRTTYTGYLRREAPTGPTFDRHPRLTRRPFLLVTPGGGGDGDGLIDWVLAAYEADPGLPVGALIAFGPFIGRDARAGFLARIARLPSVDAIAFDPKIELLMARAAGVVAMGGYNTFCEVLSFDRPALLVPRTRPRREQAIRAARAAALGLARVLEDPADEGRPRDPLVMAAALRALPESPRPGAAAVPGLLDGLDRIRDLALPWLGRAPARAAE